MPVDKYILLRWDDYTRLISKQPSQGAIDNKAFTHSQEAGLQAAPVEQSPLNPIQTHMGHGVISANDEGVLGTKPPARSKSESVDNIGRKQSLPSNRLVEGPGWGHYWEGIHFSK